VKEYRADHTPVFKDLPNLPTLGTMDIKPEKILERRMVKKGNAAISQVLVKWCKLPEDTATWEDCEPLKTKFPDILTWGQANSAGGEPVTPVSTP
jgi:hypothetical protein